MTDYCCLALGWMGQTGLPLVHIPSRAQQGSHDVDLLSNLLDALGCMQYNGCLGRAGTTGRNGLSASGTGDLVGHANILLQRSCRLKKHIGPAKVQNIAQCSFLP